MPVNAGSLYKKVGNTQSLLDRLLYTSVVIKPRASNSVCTLPSAQTGNVPEEVKWARHFSVTARIQTLSGTFYVSNLPL